MDSINLKKELRNIRYLFLIDWCIIGITAFLMLFYVLPWLPEQGINESVNVNLLLGFIHIFTMMSLLIISERIREKKVDCINSHYYFIKDGNLALNLTGELLISIPKRISLQAKNYRGVETRLEGILRRRTALQHAVGSYTISQLRKQLLDALSMLQAEELHSHLENNFFKYSLDFENEIQD